MYIRAGSLIFEQNAAFIDFCDVGRLLFKPRFAAGIIYTTAARTHLPVALIDLKYFQYISEPFRGVDFRHIGILFRYHVEKDIHQFSFRL